MVTVKKDWSVDIVDSIFGSSFLSEIHPRTNTSNCTGILGKAEIFES